ncbi:DUF1507 family protein [Marinilactibacillus psychrotolerans]|uniref:DUF1507 family protein n=2 Tax=Marinilactibacillus psychrotolerans TaxID=191770 RepID=A0A511GY14_9LACT|nr:DUF1507 family protein [Marinilactibacillus psychrotolerans]TLQ08565.1 DUF1507 family protein [Marinilactibacillus psychrotolerans]SDB96347.1 Uncharacterized protein YlaN, UPF0358 family [Marinilactibacillus psychrotolerans]SJN35482.1 Conserved hypothetical protein YlaN [Marinilactibacillus psychrotolerans 42ea]GEL66148.1 hypothetical protein MPS01_03030 [Marinilactibacillus psychrotolerans]GEQ33476.1 hypothetical protein B795N_13580 [Marinilactibacillus psychrotolerans]
MSHIENILAKDILLEDANKISQLIESQKHLCITCPAFEEVVDTQMFGFSKKIEFAIKMKMIKEEEGHLMLSELEKHLNDLLSDAFDERI